MSRGSCSCSSAPAPAIAPARRARARRLENVVFRPYQDHALLPQSLTAPDVHLVTLRPEWEGLVVPSKLYGALAAGRPVVFIGDPEGDAARIVRDGPGLVARPEPCRRSPRSCGRCAAIPSASRAWAPPRGAPTRPAQGAEPRRLGPLPAYRRPPRPRRALPAAGRGGMTGPAARTPPHRRRRPCSLRRARLPGNRSLPWRIAWHVASALVFQSALVLPSRWKAAPAARLRRRIGDGLVIKPRVTIKYPWFLEVGDDVWLGEGVGSTMTPRSRSVRRLHQPGRLPVHRHHDWNDPRFRFFCQPITLEDGVWVAAKAVICPAACSPA